MEDDALGVPVGEGADEEDEEMGADFSKSS